MAGPSPSHVARGHGWRYDHCRPTHDRATRGGAPNVQLISSYLAVCWMKMHAGLMTCEARAAARFGTIGSPQDHCEPNANRLSAARRGVRVLSKRRREYPVLWGGCQRSTAGCVPCGMECRPSAAGCVPCDVECRSEYLMWCMGATSSVLCGNKMPHINYLW